MNNPDILSISCLIPIRGRTFSTAGDGVTKIYGSLTMLVESAPLMRGGRGKDFCSRIFLLSFPVCGIVVAGPAGRDTRIFEGAGGVMASADLEFTL